MMISRLLLLVGLLCAIPGQASAAQAESRQDLEAEVQRLNERVRFLEQRMDALLIRLADTAGPEQLTGDKESESSEALQDQAAEALVTEALADNQEQRSLAPEPAFTMGGRVKLDVIANSVSVGGAGGQNRADVSFFPTAIPLDYTGEDHQASGNARDSRIWFNAVNPTPYGDLGAYIELDFGSWDNAANERVSNSHNPRLRHAYATFRGITMGQPTSTFQNMVAFPEINESNGSVGVLNTRQPLIRYTRDVGRYRWSLAAEQPETTVTARDGSRLSFDDDQLLDLVGRIDWQNERAMVSVSALVRQIRIDGVIDNRFVEEDTVGAGLSVSGRWFLPNADNLRFALASGRGIGRYVSYNSFNDAFLDSSGNLETIPMTSAFLAYQHWWSDTWRTNVALGYAEADLHPADYSTGLINERFLSSHINLLWSPIPSATFGVEWLHGRRELLNGMSGQLNRLQFTSLYKFSQ